MRAARASRKAWRALAGYADIFLENVMASGVIPQISVIMGPCAGGDVYSPAMTDFIFMVKDTSYMFVTGPDVVKTVTNEVVTAEELGGARVHCLQVGRRRRRVRKRPRGADADAPPGRFPPAPATARRRPLSPPRSTIVNREEPSLDTLVPSNANKPYDMKELILKGRGRRRTSSRSASEFAKNIVTGFARIEGETVGIVANQPLALAGVLDIDSSSRKAARFVRFCDAFEIPLVTFVDVPGFMPGTRQEYGGLIKHGAKLLVRLRRGHRAEGHRHHPQGLRRRLRRHEFKHLRGDVNYAWPTAEIAVMGAKGAVEIIFRADAKDPEKLAEREAEYKARFANPFVAASLGYIDDVIMPHGTRKRIARAFKSLRTKELRNPAKKHDNIPL